LRPGVIAQPRRAMGRPCPYFRVNLRFSIFNIFFCKLMRLPKPHPKCIKEKSDVQRGGPNQNP